MTRSTAMPRSHTPTMVANVFVQGVKSTPMPATISMMPTTSMKACAGTMCAKGGARYFCQSTSRLVNLSSPATMGTTPNTTRIVRQTASAARASWVATGPFMGHLLAARWARAGALERVPPGERAFLCGHACPSAHRGELLAQVLRRRGDDGDEERFAQLPLRGGAGEVSPGACVQERRLRRPQRPLARGEPRLQ